jgi:hypothetical protein
MATRLDSSLPSGAVFHRPAVDDGLIAFQHFPRFPELAQGAGELIRLRHQHEAAGFAVETVDHVGGGILAEVQSHAADQAGPGIGLRRVADEARRLVEHEQAVVLVDNT